MHDVVVVAPPGVVPYDLSVPCEVFARALGPRGAPAYRVRVCSVEPEVDAGYFALRTWHGLDLLDHADTVVVPGVADVDRPVPEVLLQAIRAAAARGAQVASLCSGAFVLAAAGLLDHRRATTHWLACAELARRFPAIDVDPAVLYVDGGQVLTSAGAAAGMDLCLHLVRRDLGAAAAADAARLSVTPLERDGGQAQFIVRPPAPSDSTSLAGLLVWIDDHLTADLSLAALARRARASQRTLARRFQEQLGCTPARWVTRARVRRAQHLLETGDLSIDEVAARAGFGAATTLRERFHAELATTPRAYRRAFRGR